MEFLQPRTLAAAVTAIGARPEAVPLAGGTDLMVGMNAQERRPEALLDLACVPELSVWQPAPGGDQAPSRGSGAWLRVGAAVTYRRIAEELGDRLPALAGAAGAMGSPQVRNRATIGGSLATAAPAGDVHPPLLAAGALVEAVSVRGTRRVPVAAFFRGPGRHTLAADELIAAVLVPAQAGPERFARIGGRRAMAVAWCTFAFVLRPAERRVGTGIGAAGPTPVRAAPAEEYLAERLPWSSRAPVDEPVVDRFAQLVAAAVTPADDLRGRADYRRHALTVLAARALRDAWEEYRCG